MQKKAQFWYADFLLALLILITISFLFVRSVSDLGSKQDQIFSLTSDAFSISNSLMSQPHCPSVPGNCTADWLTSSNGRVGFISLGKVQQENLTSFINLNRNDYEKSKLLLGTVNDYIFFFEDNNGPIQIELYGNSSNYYYGKPGINILADINTESLVKTTRFVYLNNNGNTRRIVRLAIVVW